MSNQNNSWDCTRFHEFLHGSHRSDGTLASEHFNQCLSCQALISKAIQKAVELWELKNPYARGSLNSAMHDHRMSCPICVNFAKSKRLDDLREFYLQITAASIERIIALEEEKDLLFADTRLLHINWCVTEAHRRINDLRTS